MPLRVVGAGLGRTGTLSLKLALERLLGGSCYHMLEVFPRPDHVAAWHAAVKGDLPDWDALYDGFRSAVDWPTAAFYRELADAYPESLVMLSVRDSESWWRSADRTIFEVFRGKLRGGGGAAGPWLDMVTDLLRVRFTEDFLDRAEAIAAYERHNDEVRRVIPPGRLVEWRPGDGWEPICRGIGVPVPQEPFPHTNTTEEFRTRAGFDS